MFRPVPPGDCTDCTAGYYCSEAGITEPIGICHQGFVCTLGADNPTPSDGVTGRPCDQGQYCINGSFTGTSAD